MQRATPPWSEERRIMMDAFFLSLRVVVGVTCVVSVCGASLIILTFIAFKDLRTLARQQLVNLSVADIMVAGSHLLGIVALRVESHGSADYLTDADGNYNLTNVSASNSTPVGTAVGTLCRVQASLTMCGTIASFLWSLALGFYMLTIIVLRRPDFARYLLVLYYPVCWLIPLAMTLWFALVKPTYFGFSQSDIAWCYGRIVPNASHTTTIMAYLLGYGLWFAITVVALVVIYLTMLCYLKFRNIHRVHNRGHTDFKLVLVPLIFFLLRVWSALLDIDTYSNRSSRLLGGDSVTHALMFIAGIGDSAQGLANAVLFCAFTKQVRAKLKKSLYSCLCCCCPNFYSRVGLPWPHSSQTSSGHVVSHETTTQLETDSTSRSLAAESYRGDQMLPAGDLLPDTDRTSLLRGSCNDDSFQSGKYGTMSYGTPTTESS